MNTVQTVILYVFLFVGLYFQTFILGTYLVNRRKIRARTRAHAAADERSYPSVTIAVPCYNEEATVGKTIESLLRLEYPAGKLRVSVIDDGSQDNTWQVIQKYQERYPDIVAAHRKENGGKYTALNYAIQHTTTDIIGCLDADSFVEPNALKRMIPYFGDWQTPLGTRPHMTAAVTPAMKIYRPRTFAQVVQRVEYLIGIFIRKVQSLISAIYVTPGPFSLFRRDLFTHIGLFRHAHNTEDMEMAFRIQSKHLHIENAHDAVVYTTGPDTVKKLYKQRVRWTSGFLMNLRDYHWILLRPRYGNMAMFTAPLGLALIFSAVISVALLLYRFGVIAWQWSVRLETIGFTFSPWHWNWFFVSTPAYLLLTVLIYALMIGIVIEAHALSGERSRFSPSIFLYFFTFPLMAPFWLIKSVYNAARSRTPSWQRERAVAPSTSRTAL